MQGERFLKAQPEFLFLLGKFANDEFLVNTKCFVGFGSKRLTISMDSFPVVQRALPIKLFLVTGRVLLPAALLEVRGT